ncbi:carbon-nitrogen hydrolase [Oscillatoria amoena NRMC-F 0135]|nr:carbon-nitrogen hydrolase [Oscillatoria amoena NRMC-F 0135]
MASLFEKRAPGVYHNTASIIDADGAYLGKYRKMHIPDDPLFYEKFYFTPGDLGFRAWQTKFGKIGVLICWDQWYPEAARLTAMQGAEILFYPTAIGWHPSEKAQYGRAHHSSWETIQRSHAVANGCYVAVANRIGHEILDGVGGDGLEFWGQSFVTDTSGQILQKASVDKEEILIQELDLDTVDTVRTHWPFLRDRRIDAYGDLTKRLID